MRLNWANYLWIRKDGYGRYGLGLVRALLRKGHDVHPFTIDVLDQPAWFRQAQHIQFDRPTIQLMPPHNMRNLAGRSVGFSMHESSILPPGWADAVNRNCEFLLVPSVFIETVMTENGVKVPMQVVKGCIDPSECQLVTPNAHRPYTFGALMDRGDRKSWDKVWTAFYHAFDFTNRDVRLVVKCRPGSVPPGLSASYSTDPRFTIWAADADDIADIYQQFDAYLCPARCEGLGMTQREAAACGVPSVVLPWSGTADDCNEWAFPLTRYALIDSNMKGCGGLWAEPDLDELVETMRWLYTHQDEARKQAAVKAQWIRDNATYAHAADTIADTLHEWLGGPEPLRSKNGHKQAVAV